MAAGALCPGGSFCTGQQNDKAPCTCAPGSSCEQGSAESEGHVVPQGFWGAGGTALKAPCEAAFVFHESVLQMIGSPRPFHVACDAVGRIKMEDGLARMRPAAARCCTFQRPPILALFRPSAGPDGNLRVAPHGWLAVVSVHLKAFDGSLEQTKAEVGGLAEHIVPWMEREVALEKEKYNASNIAVAPDVTTYIIMGDFNLSVKDSVLFTDLLPPGQPTNMGPPVTQHDKCYDNILYRREGEDQHAPPAPQPGSAKVFPVMQKELDEMHELVSVLKKFQTSLGKELTAKFVQRNEMEKALKTTVYNSWSDHKPVYVHLQSKTE